uniref:Dynactin subunit 5 n=1 Tax=Echinococcus granulosus TaxID=6210 RepID=A0A068X0T5_ECHGR|nr:hypothetical protein EgrG_002042700 [Echinococcus granulosus]
MLKLNVTEGEHMLRMGESVTISNRRVAIGVYLRQPQQSNVLQGCYLQVKPAAPVVAVNLQEKSVTELSTSIESTVHRSCLLYLSSS